MKYPDPNSYKYEEELLYIVERFRDRVRSGTREAEKFLNITEIEKLWTKLRKETNKLYTEMLSDILSEVDEGELIRKKKQNIEKRE